jgi:NADH:ubiquinone oxidoreductase subunit 4 (subunit M)
MRAARRIFWGEGPAEEFRDLSDAKGAEWGALVILGSCIVLFGFVPSLVLDFINRVTPDYLAALTQLMEPR